MKITLSFLISLFGFVVMASAQEPSESIAQLYQQKKYTEVIQQLEKIVEQEPYQDHAHYNLANAYYKVGNVGKSIYHYEWALKINPTLEEAQTNLDFAKQLKVDQLQGQLPIVKSKLFYQKFHTLSLSQWSSISIALSVACFVCFIVYYLSAQPRLKKWMLGLSLIFFIGAMISYFILNQQQNYLESKNYGVITAKEIPLQKAPRDNASSRMTLHEGTTFQIEDQTDQWYQVQLANDSIGYIKKKHCLAY